MATKSSLTVAAAACRAVESADAGLATAASTFSTSAVREASAVSAAFFTSAFFNFSSDAWKSVETALSFSRAAAGSLVIELTLPAMSELALLIVPAIAAQDSTFDAAELTLPIALQPVSATTTSTADESRARVRRGDVIMSSAFGVDDAMRAVPKL